MKKIDCYKNITELEFMGTCVSPRISKIAESLKFVASKNKVHKLLRQFGFTETGGFNITELERYYNPYRYWIDENYIDVVHSDIDHVFKIIRS